MNSITKPANSITIEYRDAAELDAKLRAILARRQAMPARMSVGWLANKLKRDTRSITRSLKRKSCPPFECQRGDSGRILWLVPNAELMEFLKSTL